MKAGLEKYFGGTGISLEALKKVMPTIGVDGTTYQIEKWLEECAVFDSLVPGKSKVWIPYGGVMEYGTLVEVVWDKYQLKNYSYPEGTEDWWVMEPHLKVSREGHEGEWYVYEVTFYKSWRRKSQMKHLEIQRAKPKRRFLSAADIAEIKKQEVIANSVGKRSSK